MNFAYVRSLITPILASLGAALALAPGAGAAEPTDAEVTIALLPKGTGLASLGSVDELAPGLMSAGIGGVPAAQTFLDVTQGNRVSESLYDDELPFVRFGETGVAAVDWQVITQRAEGAPAEVVPGLLGSALDEGGAGVGAETAAGLGRLVAVDRTGRLERLPAGGCEGGACPAVQVLEVTIEDVSRLAGGLGPGDLLIAVERPPPLFRTLSIGIAGEGFEGVLTSESTRTDGLVTSTDLAPTILETLGLDVPFEMNGQVITATGEREVSSLIDLERRLEVTGERRGPVVGETLLAWLLIVGLAVAIRRRAAAVVALPLLALALVYLPVVLLATPLLEPSLLAERLAAALVPALLAVATWRLIGGWRALGVACLVTVGAYAADVLAGSVLVPLSIPGPNPVSGSRFYGIGNEIEAIMGALLPIGVGAILASLPHTRDGGRIAAGVFLGVGLAGAAAFALGRFGADVGAAIVLPAGAAVAAAVSLGTRGGLAVALLVPIAGLAGLMAADLLLGGEAHLTRSLLDAGGFDEAGDVLERRVRLAADSFTKASNLPFLGGALAVIGLAVWKRQTLVGWFEERAALAGFAGAVAAAVVGTVSNDSGVVLLILGVAYCVVTAGFAWSLARRDGSPP
ncbi:MAG: hypothetical protein ACR2G3_04515 [Solirubrobacterales bacterium]